MAAEHDDLEDVELNYLRNQALCSRQVSKIVVGYSIVQVQSGSTWEEAYNHLSLNSGGGGTHSYIHVHVHALLIVTILYCNRILVALHYNFFYNYCIL